MRYFELVTDIGNTIHLTSDKIFFYEPEGLGYEADLQYRRTDYEWVLLDRKIKQQTIKGNLIFIGKNPYKQYMDFVNATYRSGLRLLYSHTVPGETGYTNATGGLGEPTGSGTFYWLDVTISSIKKTEYNLAGYLECPVEFIASSPWYTTLSLTTRPSRITANRGWIWETNSTWPQQFRSTVDMTITVNMTSYIPSPCMLYIRGEIKKPKWKHFVGTKLVSEGGVDCNVSEHDFLVVDNRKHPYSIKIYNELTDSGSYTGFPNTDSLVRDAYADSDFETDRFITLRRGRNTIEVYSVDTPLTADSAIIIGMEARFYHVSV